LYLFGEFFKIWRIKTLNVNYQFVDSH
jgi:hypothetical protein